MDFLCAHRGKPSIRCHEQHENETVKFLEPFNGKTPAPWPTLDIEQRKPRAGASRLKQHVRACRAHTIVCTLCSEHTTQYHVRLLLMQARTSQP